MKIINLDNINEVILETENCEYIKIPREAFIELTIIECNENTFEIDAVIRNKNLSFASCPQSSSPFNRLMLYNDIDHIRILLTDNTELSGKTVWYDNSDEDNKYQISSYRPYKDGTDESLLLSIKESNLAVSIEEIFNFDTGTILIDEYNNEYKIEMINGEKTIPNMTINKRIVSSLFKIKKG